ncbi:hypothetical protein H0H92_007738 [Tricholoma furcatifolium]|nr:hypothetical protein H0H92_007738 [Tricholoma furcatifolium]
MDQTPTALFDAYESDFKHIVQGIKEKLEASGTGEQRKAALRKVEIELDDADDIVSALEVEIQGIPQSVKAPYLARLKEAKAELTRYKKLAKDVHAKQSRAELLARSGDGGRSSDDPYGERSDRARLLSGTQILEDGSRRLRDTQRIALEAEDQGADILRTLRGQRETIETARDTLRGAETNIDRASGTVKKMIVQYQIHCEEMAEFKRPLPSDDSFEEGVAKKLKNENDDTGANSVTVTVHSSDSLSQNMRTAFEINHALTKVPYVSSRIGNITTAFKGVKPKSVEHRRIIKDLKMLYSDSDCQLPYKTGHINKAFKLTITRPGCEFKGSISEAIIDLEYLKTWFDNAVISGYGDNRALETKVDSAVRDAREITSDEFQVQEDLLSKIGSICEKFFFPRAKFRIAPYKIHLYGPGGHFKTHRDTPELNLVGTFLLGLGDTCPDEGCFTIGEEKLHADIGYWVAFYPDVPHAISPLPDDTYRAVLAFKVFRDGGPTAAPLMSRELALRQRVEEVVNSIPRPFGIILDHDYCMGTIQPNGYDATLLAAMQQRKDSIIHFMPVVLRSSEYVEYNDGDSRWGTGVYPFLPAHIEIANERETPDAERTVKIFENWKDVPFFCPAFNRKAGVWSKDEQEIGHTGNECDAKRETTIYLSHALLVLPATGKPDEGYKAAVTGQWGESLTWPAGGTTLSDHEQTRNSESESDDEQASDEEGTNDVDEGNDEEEENDDDEGSEYEQGSDE